MYGPKSSGHAAGCCPALPASRVARKSIQDNVLPNHVKGSGEGENSLPFCLIFPSRGWPSSPELNRATHLLDDVGGGMVGEIRKEVHNATKKEGAIPPPPVKEDPILPLRSRAGKDGTDAIYI